jgi:sugar phosphate isomerase/epimerase
MIDIIPTKAEKIQTIRYYGRMLSELGAYAPVHGKDERDEAIEYAKRIIEIAEAMPAKEAA